MFGNTVLRPAFMVERVIQSMDGGNHRPLLVSAPVSAIADKSKQPIWDGYARVRDRGVFERSVRGSAACSFADPDHHRLDTGKRNHEPSRTRTRMSGDVGVGVQSLGYPIRIHHLSKENVSRPVLFRTSVIKDDHRASNKIMQCSSLVVCEHRDDLNQKPAESRVSDDRIKSGHVRLC